MMASAAAPAMHLEISSVPARDGAVVMRTPLDAGGEIKPPDMRLFEEGLKNLPKQEGP